MATHSSEVDHHDEIEERLRREASLSQLGLLALSSNSLSVVLETACRMTAETLALDSVRIVNLDNLECSCLTVAQYGKNVLSGQFDSIARFATAHKGQTIISDLSNEQRFPVESSLTGSSAATAIAICKCEINPFHFFVFFLFFWRAAGV